MTMYLQTKTDMFAAAVSHAGTSDVTSYWGEGYWGYSYDYLLLLPEVIRGVNQNCSSAELCSMLIR